MHLMHRPLRMTEVQAQCKPHNESRPAGCCGLEVSTALIYVAKVVMCAINLPEQPFSLPSAPRATANVTTLHRTRPRLPIFAGIVRRLATGLPRTKRLGMKPLLSIQ
jgi:hypothetical protein